MCCEVKHFFFSFFMMSYLHNMSENELPGICVEFLNSFQVSETRLPQFSKEILNPAFSFFFF